MTKNQEKAVIGYLPDEKPTMGKTLLFALQQILVMFPATVTVALLTGFHISTTIFASGLATLGFLFVTKGKLPLYYGSSFSYIAAILGITGAEYGGVVTDALISKAQFGIIASGLVSIAAGLLINRFGHDKIEKILPASITGSISMIIGLSLAGSALVNASGYDAATGTVVSGYWLVAGITLFATIFFSVYIKKGVLGQLPILLGITVGYIASIALNLVDFSQLMTGEIISVPHFTLPTVSWSAVLAIMPIALATIPESTAHLYQLDVYVNNLAERKKTTKKYPIADKLGLNLIGDGIGDMISALFGGPAGTNYGENLSTMAITKNFSVWVLVVTAIMAIVMSFFTPITNFVNTIPAPVINGACIYLFGVIGAQGIAIMINKKVDLFDSKNLAVIAVILIVGIGGSFAFPGGLIPIGTMQLPAIATASLLGIALNFMLSFSKSDAEIDAELLEEE